MGKRPTPSQRPGAGAGRALPASATRRRWALTGLVLGVVAVGIIALVASQGGASGGRPTAWADLRTIDAHSLSFVGDGPTNVLFGHHQGVFASSDGGRSWDLLGLGRDAMQMAPAGAASIVISGHEVFAASIDGGQTWADVPNDLPHLDIHGFARDPLNPDHMWAYLAGGGVYESSDGGHRWLEVFAGDILFLQAVAAEGAVRLLGVDMRGLCRAATAAALGTHRRATRFSDLEPHHEPRGHADADRYALGAVPV